MVVTQGDSLWIDIPVPNYKAIDSTWSNWTGTYDVAATVTGDSVVAGDLLSASEGTFALRLNTDNTSWAGINVGKYKLMIQITNDVQKYQEEKHDNLQIVAQGL